MKFKKPGWTSQFFQATWLHLIFKNCTDYCSKNFHEFAFISEGPKGRIIKAVIYEPTWKKKNQYNLGFGDFREGRIDCKVVSSNDDLMKVMNTVAKTVYLFLDAFPGNSIYIQPVDERRSMLYHAIFKRRQAEIEANFVVRGLFEGDWETYNPEKHYFAFEIKRSKD